MKSPCVVPDVDLCMYEKSCKIEQRKKKKPALSKPDLHLIQCLCFHSFLLFFLLFYFSPSILLLLFLPSGCFDVVVWQTLPTPPRPSPPPFCLIILLCSGDPESVF